MNENRNTKWFELQPVDAWFFRDGRPSNFGEDQSDLQSLFPPSHHTIIGAIRAALARELGWKEYGDWSPEIKGELGNGFDDLGPLSFVGPCLAYKHQPIFSLPRHVWGEVSQSVRGLNDHGHKGRALCFTPRNWLHPSAQPIRCDAGEVHLPISASITELASGSKPLRVGDDFYVTCAGLNRILQGQLPDSNDCLHATSLFSFEARVGIARNPDTNTTDERAVYSPHYVRLANEVSLQIGIDGLAAGLSLPSLFPLGGESRLAACEPIKTPSLPQSAESGQLIVLASPARFSTERWYGAGPSQAASQLNNVLEGGVKTTTIDRPLRIGGFDSRNRTPLPLIPFAPPGTVWWMDQTIQSNSGPLFLGSHTDYGYGLAFIGKGLNSV